VARILLIHWNLCGSRRGASNACVAKVSRPPASPIRETAPVSRALRENPPDAVVIDLARLPSQGQAVGIALREQKATRMVPLVFIEADPEKTARVRGLLPDAAFTTWPRIGAALRRALRHPSSSKDATPSFPTHSQVTPGTPLPKKLRIQEGSVVALVHAPEGFEAKLAPLPEGARVERSMGHADVILAFVKSTARRSGRELAALAREMQAGRTLWLTGQEDVALAGDLGEPKVREWASPPAWWIQSMRRG